MSDNNFVNKMKKGNVNYDINDARIGPISAEDEGKSLVIDEEGKLVPGEGGSGPKVYQVDDITDLSEDFLTQINLGDVVINSVSNDRSAFICVFKSPLYVDFSQPLTNGTVGVSYTYNDNDNVWECGGFYSPLNIIKMEIDTPIYNTDGEFVAGLEVGSMILDDDGVNWTIVQSAYDDESGVSCIYLSTNDINLNRMTYIRFIFDEDENEWIFDEDYGYEGYNDIPLGGSSGSVQEITEYDMDENNIRTITNPIWKNAFANNLSNFIMDGRMFESFRQEWDSWHDIPADKICFTLQTNTRDNGYDQRLIVYSALLYSDGGSCISGISGTALVMIVIEGDQTWIGDVGYYPWPSSN